MTCRQGYLTTPATLAALGAVLMAVQAKGGDGGGTFAHKVRNRSFTHVPRLVTFLTARADRNLTPSADHWLCLCGRSDFPRPARFVVALELPRSWTGTSAATKGRWLVDSHLTGCLAHRDWGMFVPLQTFQRIQKLIFFRPVLSSLSRHGALRCFGRACHLRLLRVRACAGVSRMRGER
jgi:hypothetical protein